MLPRHCGPLSGETSESYAVFMMAMSPSPRVVTPAPRQAWIDVLASDPDATVQQSPAWCDAVVRASGAADISRLYLLPDGRQLVLPLVRRRLIPGLHVDGSYLAKFGPGGLLASDGLQESDARLVLDDLHRSVAVSTRIRVNFDVADRWRAALAPDVLMTSKRSEVLDLTGGFQQVFERRFQSSVRRAVRKAECSGITVERDSGPRLASEYYQLYMRWSEDRATVSGLPRRLVLARARRRQPAGYIEAVSELLGENCEIWVAFYGGEPIASIITLRHGAQAVYWQGSSVRRLAGPLRANVLLQRLAIEAACNAGCRYYDLGESGGVAGLEHFKQTLGAVPRFGMDLRIERLPLSSLQGWRHGLEQRASSLARRISHSGVFLSRRTH